MNPSPIQIERSKPAPRTLAPRRPWLLVLLSYGVPAGFVFVISKSVTYSLFVALGPLAGGAARDWQSCCAENSFGLLPFGLAALGFAAFARLAPLDQWRVPGALRAAGWTFGWLVWFALALLSYAHALE